MRPWATPLFASAAATGVVSFANAEELFVEESEQARFAVTVVADGMDFPWDMAFLPNGDALISEYDGRLRLFQDGALSPEAIPAIDRVTARGGLRGIALHPDFEENRLVYFCYATGTHEANHTEIARGRFDGAEINDVEVVFAAENTARQLAHYGCRLLWDAEGRLIATLGDRRHHMEESQSLSDHYGVVVRIDENGEAPANNPFVNERGAKAEIWAFGVRNAQGADFHPETGDIWFSEHGPLGGDEINILKRGANFGWPVATYGIDYDGTVLTETPLRDDVEAPLFYWYPSIAPSSLSFYDGDLFAKWRGDLFMTTLASQRLLRFELIGDRIVREETLLSELGARLRNVEPGPDGALYVLTDAGDGRLLKLTPAAAD
ncbi:MAG: PQQ-dependent sugar dehydrogenase [Pseudomonadota bacterium]